MEVKDAAQAKNGNSLGLIGLPAIQNCHHKQYLMANIHRYPLRPDAKTMGSPSQLSPQGLRKVRRVILNGKPIHCVHNFWELLRATTICAQAR